MWIILVPLIAATGVWILYRNYAKTFEAAKQYSGPPALPIIGNGLWFLNKSPVEFIQIIGELVAIYGNHFRFWQGPQLLIYTGNPAHIESILTNRHLTDKSSEYNFLSDWLGDGLLLSSRQKWHTRRKAITPAFHFKILDQFVEVFDRNASELVDVLGSYADSGAIVDIFPYVLLYTLDVICETAMGTSVKALRNADSEYVQAVKQAATISIRRMLDIIRRTPLFYLTPSYIRLRKMLKILHGYTDNVIVSRRQQLKNQGSKNMPNDTGNEMGLKKREAFLDLLLQTSIDGKQLTNLEIREEVDTFMFEGHDTTTSAVSFTLYNLAKYPAVQQKAYEEVVSVMGENTEQAIEMSHLQDLPYLEMVIKETLRLYPSVPLIGRRCVKEVTIEGKTIPAGANIIIGIFYMGRDPNYFERPLEFIPERFEGEKSVEKFNPYKYIPFSAGPRNCIGQKFALNEMKSVLSKLLRHYEFILPVNSDEPVLASELILKPDRGVPLQIRRRTLKHN
ncbi:cytochrome P450 4d1-like [Wyeomyia smithii]|uniref:cytochrome P450 4d1-like n=1 Tax=Wyeomyia smithii TaxID=174621 RepID=UPI002467CF14|nr:cytochrome P450 4d1-like [Wyeomyia smithii]XP_055549738.1 cytochrome P450 4d1-like [Wyeomyia smithii]XP_055549739.1 cytochrome P450 4d1-like [Wyeomyia smithii]